MLQQLLFKRKNSFNLSITDCLCLSVCFSILLLFARFVETGRFTYAFLLWNLFLAFVPYAISNGLSARIRLVKNRWALGLVILCWLLFIPNSFYILTDLFHLEHFDGMPKWFDLLLVFSFAWNGILFGVISIRRIHLILSLATRKVFSELAIFLFMWVNAFGVYLGRYSRFNSWDVLGKPFTLAADMVRILFHPMQNKMEWGMITTYAAFMWLLYFTLIKLREQNDAGTNLQ